MELELQEASVTFNELYLRMPPRHLLAVGLGSTESLHALART